MDPSGDLTRARARARAPPERSAPNTAFLPMRASIYDGSPKLYSLPTFRARARARARARDDRFSPAIGGRLCYHAPSRGIGMIEARGLTKRYGTFTAVDGIDLSISGAGVVGF